MQAFEVAPVRRVRVEVFTAACRVSGTTPSRFSRVADILNLLGSSHLVLDEATLVELAAPDQPRDARRFHVALDEILVLIAEGDPEPRPEMRIPKRRAQAEIFIPPLRIAGNVHVGVGTRPADGLLNAADRFLPMTEAILTSTPHGAIEREVAALAFRRDRAHALAVADDEEAGQLLADVLDSTTAERWLAPQREGAL